MIRIGVIGAGRNGAGHCRQFAEGHGKRCRIAAVADVNEEAGRELAGQFDAKAVTKPEDLFEHVDAVVISSPNFLHVDHAVASASAGKHVWVEKPMALSTGEADRIADAVEKAGVASMVGFSVRFASGPRTMKQYYEDGKLGDLLSIWSRRLAGFGGNRSKSWRGPFVKSGGVMSELIAHEIDWLVSTAGLPESVYCRVASQLHDDPRANDHVWMTFALGGEVTGTIEGSQMATISDYYKGVMGSKACIYDRKWGKEVWLQTGRKEDNQVDQLDSFDKHGHFLDVIEGKCASLADVQWGRKIVAISEKALESAVSGQVVKLDGAL